MSFADAASRITDRTGSEDWRETLARFGLVGKGVLHLVVGLLAYQLATGSAETTEAAGNSGAIAWIGELPAGALLLWVLAASLLALSVWRLVTLFAGDPGQDDDLPHRISYGVKFVFYGGLAVAAARAAMDGGSSSSSGSDSGEQAADTIAGLPGGRFLLFAIGVGIIGIAAYLAYEHAYKAGFVQRLRVGESDRAATFGRIGYGLRSVAYVLVGFLFFQAGLSGDEDQAKGLAGSLADAADASWGTPFLLAVALGFASYGVYCFFEAMLRRNA